MLKRWYYHWLSRRLLRVLKKLDNEWFEFLDRPEEHPDSEAEMGVLSEANRRQMHALDMAMVTLHELS